MITKYNNYLNRNKILEALRTFPLFLSDRLRDILGKMEHDAAKELLSMHSDLDTRVSKTFIDIHDEKNNFFTFTQPNKAIRILDLDISDDDELSNRKNDIFNKIDDNIDDNSDVYKKFRSEIRIGSFLSEIFGDKYPESLRGGQNTLDRESFVNLYKAIYSEEETFLLFDIVNGNDISKWYHYSKYDMTNDDSSLSNSCMRSKPEYIFEIYTKNPEKVSLVILYSNSTHSKIKGRAILWKLDNPEGRFFMDRVYVDDYSDEQLYINFAKKNNWLYKQSQSMGCGVRIIDPSRGTDAMTINMSLELNHIHYDSFPYCDTMVYYNSIDYIIGNNTNINPTLELVDTGGQYYTIDDDFDYNDEGVYSEYHDTNIPRSQATWCSYGNDWVRTDEAWHVLNSGGENYAVPGHPGIVKQEIYVNNQLSKKYFLQEKCVWSDYLNTWIFNTSAVNVWLDKEKTKIGIEYKKRKNVDFFEINGENYTKELVDIETKTLL